MSKRIPASFWWRSIDNTFDRIVRQYLTKAQQADKSETGHECGHQFEISVRSILHISGPGEHSDADWSSDVNKPVVVRAHNLRDALLIAATLPLGEWFEDE